MILGLSQILVQKYVADFDGIRGISIGSGARHLCRRGHLSVPVGEPAEVIGRIYFMASKTQ
jgi:hypothetical protein